jgi:hypothetical protein
MKDIIQLVRKALKRRMRRLRKAFKRLVRTMLKRMTRSPKLAYLGLLVSVALMTTFFGDDRRHQFIVVFF